jgi:hypothetical protein
MVLAAQQEPFATAMVAARTVLSAATMVIAARQEIIAALMVAARTVKPAAAMVVARREILAAATLFAARQEPFAAPTRQDAVLWEQPAQEMDTANKISRCCRKLLPGLLIVTLRKYMQNKEGIRRGL